MRLDGPIHPFIKLSGLLKNESGRGTRYTRGRGPFKIIWRSKNPLTRSEALMLELKIKVMRREQKKALFRDYELLSL